MSTKQYHRITHTLYQFEGMTDELVAQMDYKHVNKLLGQMCHGEETMKQKWKTIKEKVEEVCMEMYHEVECPIHGEATTKTWNHKQQVHVVDQWSGGHSVDVRSIGDITYFNRGQRRRRRRRVEESEDEYSDEEE